MTPPVRETLYRDSYRQLLGYVRARISDPEDAEDVVQSLYVKLYRAVENGKRVERPEAFLFTSARNAVIDYYRTRKRHAELPELQDDLGDGDPADETRKIMTGWMHPLVEELEEPYRSTLRMSELQERPYREIAAELGITVSAVKSRVRRGREQMRHALLDCCRFAFDAAGRVIDYEPKRRSSSLVRNTAREMEQAGGAAPACENNCN